MPLTDKFWFHNYAVLLSCFGFNMGVIIINYPSYNNTSVYTGTCACVVLPPCIQYKQNLEVAVACSSCSKALNEKARDLRVYCT